MSVEAVSSASTAPASKKRKVSRSSAALSSSDVGTSYDPNSHNPSSKSSESVTQNEPYSTQYLESQYIPQPNLQFPIRINPPPVQPTDANIIPHAPHMVPVSFEEIQGHPLNKPTQTCISLIDAKLFAKLEYNQRQNIENTGVLTGRTTPYGGASTPLSTGTGPTNSNSASLANIALLNSFNAAKSTNTDNESQSVNNSPSSRSSSRPLTETSDLENSAAGTTLNTGTSPSLAVTSKKLPLLYYTEDHPQNRRGFRYSYCRTIDTSLPNLQYASIEVPPYTARGSYFDRSPSIALSRDAMTVSTLRGFSTSRANVFVREGSWYYETKILHANSEDRWPLDQDRDAETDQPEARNISREEAQKKQKAKSTNGGPSSVPSTRSNSRSGTPNNIVSGSMGHVRIGLARREACLQAPIGFDGYGYGLRDTTGESVHLSRPKPFMNEPFKSGDVIGIHLFLPKIDSYLGKQREKLRGENKATTNSYKTVSRDRIPIKYKGQMYFESLEYQTTKTMDQLIFSGGKKKKREDARNDTNNSEEIEQDSESEDEYIDQDGQELIPGSFVDVYKNGKYMGRAFKNLKSFMPPSSKHGKNKDLPPPPPPPVQNPAIANLAQKSRTSTPIPGLATSSTGATLLNGVPITSTELGDLSAKHTSKRFSAAGSNVNGNGTPLSPAPTQVFSPDDGHLGYYPCISVFKGGVAQYNFGPHFDALPEAISSKIRYSKCSKMGDVYNTATSPYTATTTTTSTTTTTTNNNHNHNNTTPSFSTKDQADADKDDSDSIVRPLCERYHEQIAEDTTYDLIDEVEFGILAEIEKRREKLEEKTVLPVTKGTKAKGSSRSTLGIKTPITAASLAEASKKSQASAAPASNSEPVTGTDPS